MPLPGGPADKAGNRYEARWTVNCLAQVLHGEFDSIRLEPPGPEGEGVEFCLRRDDAREYHQVKRQGARRGHWTLRELRDAGVLTAFQSHLGDANATCVFVSIQDAPELRELAERARGAADLPEFERDFAKGEWGARLSELLTYWPGCTRDKVFALLKRIVARTIDEETLRRHAELALARVVSGDVAAAHDLLFSCVFSNIHRQLDAKTIWEYLASRGFSPISGLEAHLAVAKHFVRQRPLLIWIVVAVVMGVAILPFVTPGNKAFAEAQLAAQSENWESLPALLTDARAHLDARDHARHLELDLIEATMLLHQGRLARAWQLIRTTEAHVNPGDRLSFQIEYLTTLYGRLSGLVFDPRDELRGLLQDNRAGQVPLDIRFDAAYDLAICDVEAGQWENALAELENVRNLAADDAVRFARARLLEAILCYMRGDLKRAEELLSDERPFEKLGKRRRGIRYMYLAMCLARLQDARDERPRSITEKQARRRAVECFQQTGEVWYPVVWHEFELNRALDYAREQPEQRRHVDEAQHCLTELREFRCRVIHDGFGDQADCQSQEYAHEFEPRRLSADLYEIEITLAERENHVDSDAAYAARLKDAEALAIATLADAEANKLVLIQTRARAALGELACRRGERASCEAALGQAITLAAGGGLRAEVARLLLLRAACRSELGDFHCAIEDIECAAALYDELSDPQQAAASRESAAKLRAWWQEQKQSPSSGAVGQPTTAPCSTPCP